MRSIIGFGSPNKANTTGLTVHLLATKKSNSHKAAYGWPENEKFLVPREVPEYFAATRGKRGAAAQKSWTESFAAYKTKFPKKQPKYSRLSIAKLPEGWDSGLKPFAADPKEWQLA